MSPRARSAQGGVAAVEMAVILPVFLLLLMGTAEIGHACYQYNVLAKAVRDGARYASATARNAAGIVDLTAENVAAARNLVVTGNPAGSGAALLPGLDAGDVTVVESPAGYVTVSVAYEYVPMLAAIPTFGGTGNVGVAGTLSAATVMAAM